MPSLVDLAELSRAAYESSGDAEFEHLDQSRVWRRERAWRNPIGFHVAEFSDDSGALVLAFRGTDDLFDGVLDDAAIAAGHMPPQLLPALRVVEFSEARFVTGHSLGGALALLVGASANRRVVTFNAPGVFEACLRLAAVTASQSTARSCVRDSLAVNVRVDGDAVSSRISTGRQVGGRDVTLSAPGCGFDLLCRHGIAKCIEVLRQNEDSFSPL